MSSAAIEPVEHSSTSQKASFFRQSGWMMITSVGGGAFMAFIHVFSKVLPAEEYSAFGTLLQLVNWMGIPAIGLQMVFAQQTPAAITDNQRRQLVGTARAVLLWTFCLWLGMVAIALIFRDQFISSLKLSNPMALWLTVLVGWMMLWYPITQGLMQGRQNFLWLGWTYIFNGVGRVGIGAVIVYGLHGWTAGLMAGVFIGLALAAGTGFWQNRDLLSAPSAPFDWKGWLKRVVPLTMGFGVTQFLLSADAIVVQNYLGEGGKAAPYIFGGTLARAIVLFTLPIAAVMFPKLVHSAARSQKSNLMGVTFIGTAILASLAVLGLMLTAPFLIAHGSKPENLSILPDLPLFGWAMVPLAAGNVLLYNLMAHSRFKISLPLVVMAIAYWIALQHYHDTFRMVIKTLGVFNLIYLAMCALFTWVIDKPKSPEVPVGV
jgi:O-antigen/teichoic acid export membrane protein